MQKQLDLFTYAEYEVRVISDPNGNPWFVAADVCKALEIKNVSDTLNKVLDADERGIDTIDTNGGPQNLSVINESGLYSLILRSRKPGAKKFKRWITHEVLPSIRKTGTYSIDPKHELSDSEKLAEAFVLATTYLERAKARIEELAVYETPGRAWQEYVESTSETWLVSEAGKLLSSRGLPTGPRKLFEWLAAHSWVYRTRGQWVASQKHTNQGLISTTMSSWRNPRTGKEHFTTQVRITMKGIAEIHRQMSGEQGLLQLEKGAAYV